MCSIIENIVIEMNRYAEQVHESHNTQEFSPTNGEEMSFLELALAITVELGERELVTNTIFKE